MNDRVVDVAAAVIERPDGSFLLAQRPTGKVYAGYWEFPGGKVEPGETVVSALIRELREELGVEVEVAYPWITRVYVYPHATVRLHFLRVVGWQGEPHPCENQAVTWQMVNAISVSPMLPANAPVLKALSTPIVYGITHAWKVGVETAIRQLAHALDRGLRLVQLRESNMDMTLRRPFCATAVSMVHSAGGIVLVNGDETLARAVGADGVHLPARQLMKVERRPDFEWCAASCHDAGELARAAELELDFAVLGPVLPTPSHAGMAGIGWQVFAELARGCPVPVLALGGVQPHDLERARLAGAHGIAMVRGAWPES